MKRPLLAALAFALVLAAPLRAVTYNISWGNTAFTVPSTVSFTGQIEVANGFVVSGYIDVLGSVTSGPFAGNYAGHYNFIAPDGPLVQNPDDGVDIPTDFSPLGYFYTDGKFLSNYTPLPGQFGGFVTAGGLLFGAGGTELNFFSTWEGNHLFQASAAGYKHLGSSNPWDVTLTEAPPPASPIAVPDGGATVLLVGAGLAALAAIRPRYGA